jgi:hypothetical protein
VYEGSFFPTSLPTFVVGGVLELTILTEVRWTLGVILILISFMARFRRPKIACSPSYADYRHKTNAIVLLEFGHTLKGECSLEE